MQLWKQPFQNTQNVQEAGQLQFPNTQFYTVQKGTSACGVKAENQHFQLAACKAVSIPLSHILLDK